MPSSAEKTTEPDRLTKPLFETPGAPQTVSSSDVRKSEADRAKARAKRKVGRPSKAELAQRAQSSSSAPAKASLSPASLVTEADVKHVRIMLEQGQAPLRAAEKQLAPLGVEAGELALSDSELEFGSQAIAGSLAAVTPDVAKYLPFFALAMWVLGVGISRGLVLYRTAKVAEAMENEAKKASEQGPLTLHVHEGKK